MVKKPKGSKIDIIILKNSRFVGTEISYLSILLEFILKANKNLY